MSVPNRKDIREALATLLQSGVTAAQSVYAYPKHDLDGETPLVVISSSGSERERQTLMQSSAVVYLDIYTFTLQSGEGWSEADAENAMDTIEQEIYSVLNANRTTAHWKYIDYDGRTDARRPLAMPGGVIYLQEIIPIGVQVF